MELCLGITEPCFVFPALLCVCSSSLPSSAAESPQPVRKLLEDRAPVVRHGFFLQLEPGSPPR